MYFIFFCVKRELGIQLVWVGRIFCVVFGCVLCLFCFFLWWPSFLCARPRVFVKCLFISRLLIYFMFVDLFHVCGFISCLLIYFMFVDLFHVCSKSPGCIQSKTKNTSKFSCYNYVATLCAFCVFVYSLVFFRFLLLEIVIVFLYLRFCPFFWCLAFFSRYGR